MFQKTDIQGSIACFMLLLSLTASGPETAFAQDPHSKDARYYFQEARKAYQEKNYAAYVDNLKTALALRPTHQSYMYYLAAGYALIGKKQEALAQLSSAVDMGLVYDAEKSTDLASLRDTDEFKRILKRIEDNKLPLNNSLVAFTGNDKSLIPEGLAFDPVKRLFFLSSVYKRKIVSVDAKGRMKDFSTEADGLWSVMGMKVDAKRRRLWVCTASQPQMSNPSADDNGKSGIFKYDLRTGRLIKRYLLSNKPKAHWLGDLVVNSRGDVFASDSVSPAIYVIDHRKDKIDLFMDGAPFVNLQGLAFTADEKRLFIADYSLGLFLIDVRTKRSINLSPPSRTTLLGIDGLYSYQGSLIGVQNGINPNRVVRIFIDGESTEIERFEVLEVNNPIFNEPTLGVVVRDQFYFIANSQWSAIDDQGRIGAPQKLTNPTILRLQL